MYEEYVREKYKESLQMGDLYTLLLCEISNNFITFLLIFYAYAWKLLERTVFDGYSNKEIWYNFFLRFVWSKFNILVKYATKWKDLWWIPKVKRNFKGCLEIFLYFKTVSWQPVAYLLKKSDFFQY